MIKKSKGLKAKFIDNAKFKISAFQGYLAEDALKIIPKTFKGIQKARRDYQEIKAAPEELNLE
ncbi:MAG: hypothetical protein ACFFFT_11010 [Candidatus Thorarchaeota archaeon]